jgi:hypothetical protein
MPSETPSKIKEKVNHKIDNHTFTRHNDKEKNRIANKKSSITLAIDEQVLDIIREEAGHDSKSVNGKVNDVLTRYAFFYRYTEKAGAAVVLPHTVDFVIRNIDDAKWVEEMQNVVMDAYRILLLEHNVELNLENIIKMLSTDAVYAGIYKGFSYFPDDGRYLNLLFRHERGLRWSKILSEGYSYLFEKVLNYRVQPTLFDSGFIIKILERNSQTYRLIDKKKGRR